MGKNNAGPGKGSCFDLFFVKPLKGSNAHEAAKALSRLKGVREVLLTEGSYGFVLKAEAGSVELARELGRYEKVTCYYTYRK